MPINKGMDKEGVVLLYIYTMNYYSVIKKNEIRLTKKKKTCKTYKKKKKNLQDLPKKINK